MAVPAGHRRAVRDFEQASRGSKGQHRKRSEALLAGHQRSTASLPKRPPACGGPVQQVRLEPNATAFRPARAAMQRALAEYG